MMFKNEDLKIKNLKLFRHLADLPCPLLNGKKKKKQDSIKMHYRQCIHVIH